MYTHAYTHICIYNHWNYQKIGKQQTRKGINCSKRINNFFLYLTYVADLRMERKQDAKYKRIWKDMDFQKN